MKTDEQIREMKAAKKHEDPTEEPGYNHGVRDGWIHALDWMLGD